MPSNDGPKLGVIALTLQGTRVARQIATAMHGGLYLPARFAAPDESSFGKGQFTVTCQQLFQEMDCVICVMATGIVVRTIAPLIKDKTVDPAVLVVDERAHHVISLLSGHVGGANAWATQLATLLDSDPVITTATDTEHVQALDTLAQQVDGWYPDFKFNTKKYNSLLAAGEPVEIWIDPAFNTYFPDLSGFRKLTTLADASADVPLVIVSDKVNFEKRAASVQVIPRVNALGIGCRKNVTFDMIQTVFTQFCIEHQLAWQSIYALGSIEKKQHEGAIHYLADTLNVPVTFYTAAALKPASQHYPQSTFVAKTVGVGNVACAAAETLTGQRTITDRFALDEITIAMSRKSL
ncbi:cobalt-precorrin 5A hydrolase [Secundilactobacillus paracollinoides]|uniref:Cobalamin biosynthesis protein CbiG n=1 Tax=Secundilactobacillus paracollinoides TaxID=240427 RepID=A0A1B2IYG0_9LACO|nr:cobalt-precorrin 5A hydrolase [Secundilactobacillus paracollinoides]ANZ61166.1 cobalamin biosynthesis protein CbiG [Secundilactobacillus paracollinoides]ANZ67087.1 cobalamin biosynthesis protein CbiG [Secundilactobacillus paracollinoides]